MAGEETCVAGRAAKADRIKCCCPRRDARDCIRARSPGLRVDREEECSCACHEEGCEGAACQGCDDDDCAWREP